MSPLFIILAVILCLVVLHFRDKKQNKAYKNLVSELDDYEDIAPKINKNNDPVIDKLMLYMVSTREALLIYDKSHHDPKMAVVALEMMKKKMKELEFEFKEPNKEKEAEVEEVIEHFDNIFTGKGA